MDNPVSDYDWPVQAAVYAMKAFPHHQADNGENLNRYTNALAEQVRADYKRASDVVDDSYGAEVGSNKHKDIKIRLAIYALQQFDGKPYGIDNHAMIRALASNARHLHDCPDED